MLNETFIVYDPTIFGDKLKNDIKNNILRRLIV